RQSQVSRSAPLEARREPGEILRDPAVLMGAWRGVCNPVARRPVYCMAFERTPAGQCRRPPTTRTCGGARRYNRRRLNLNLLKELKMNSRVLSSVALAAAAAVMFSTVAASTARADEGKVKCEGVNSCKGHSACKGQNSCKGKGFLEMTKAECDAAKAKATK